MNSNFRELKSENHFFIFSTHGVCSPGLAESPGSGSLTCRLSDGGWAGAVEGVGWGGRGKGRLPWPLSLFLSSQGCSMQLSVGAAWPFSQAAQGKGAGKRRDRHTAFRPLPSDVPSIAPTVATAERVTEPCPALSVTLTL